MTSNRLLGYLKSWYATSTQTRLKEGVIVELTLDEFMALFTKKQLASLELHLKQGRITTLQNVENDFAYVLTWTSYAARSTNRFNSETACVCSRMKSRQINQIQKGDIMRPTHVNAIKTALTGKPKDKVHKENISKGKKGVKIAAWSEERHAKNKARLAAKKENMK